MKSFLAKSPIAKILVAILITTALAGCGTIQQESAMEWLDRNKSRD